MTVEGQEKPSIKTHGVAGYKKGCRCDKCRAAKRARNKEEHKKRLLAAEADGASFEHGYGGFTHRGCRCDICRTAKAEDRSGGNAKAQRLRQSITRQAQTLDQAARRGQQWTGPELELVARTDLTSREVAAMIGRTYYAVAKARERLRGDPKTIAVAGIPKGLPDPDGEG